MQKPLSFAVIGCGMLARQQHIPNIIRSAESTLHTLCDLSEETLAECRNAFAVTRTTTDFREAVADPEVDAVVLATTERVRLPVIEACAEARKPIYVEKPIAGSLAELYAIQRVVNQAGIPFCAGHNRRNAPAMIDAHRIFRHHMTHPGPCSWRFDREGAGRPRLADDGTAGMLVRINDDWYSWKGWVFDKEDAPFGPMLFEMTHFTDLCNWFLAAEPTEVVALSGGMLNHGVIVRYATGEIATISMSANGTFGYPKELYEMMGQGGIVVVDHMVEVRTAGIADAPPRICYPVLDDPYPDMDGDGGLPSWLAKKRRVCREIAEGGDPMRILVPAPDRGHAHALDRFVDEIRGQGPRVCGIDEAVLATRVAFAAITADRERRVVRLDEV
ncbi:MAG TPA: Gfo/Idh/MocA family oxidoreductase [Candidatus Hydrogenedentes bacterium]|nr:Gfo/Idh/MocA family oxidoreductase [Candidatus Hydrogenedentota bacterium]HPG67083.1 Gfo/Idh/MocA family oxidoreductase [Candidatus Hydrogenedentota bacterium]